LAGKDHHYSTRGKSIDYAALCSDVPSLPCAECGLAVYDTDLTAKGCDAQGCGLWFHNNCLENDVREQAEISVANDGDWLCPQCTNRVTKTCVVCLVTEVSFLNTAASIENSGMIQCSNVHCNLWYHINCLPPRVLQGVVAAVNWCCDQCFFTNES